MSKLTKVTPAKESKGGQNSSNTSSQRPAAPQGSRMNETDVIGWILAWLPEGAKNYNFEFFAESGASGHACKYSYDPDGNSNGVRDVGAMQRADHELKMLQGGATKYGMKVVDGYIMPVMGRKLAGN